MVDSDGEVVRVMHVVSRMNVGGPARLLWAIRERLDPSQFDVRVYHGDVGPGERDLLTSAGSSHRFIRIRGLGRRVDPFDDIRCLWTLVKTMREWKPHIVHTHTSKAGVLGRLAAWMARTPVTVHTYHGHLLSGYFGPVAVRVIIAVERVLARRSTALVAVGEQVRDDLRREGIGTVQRFEVIVPGVEHVDLPDSVVARRSLGIEDSVPTVGFIGRLTAIKRVDRLIEAMHHVWAIHPDTVLIVAGSGDLEDELRRASSGSQGRVIFVGHRDDIGTILAASDVIALTSDNEGLPLALVEAALAARPIVATAVGSVGEIVENDVTGFLVDPQPIAIGSGISRLVGDPSLRSSLGNNGRVRAIERFSLQKFVTAHQDLYDSLLSDRGGIPRGPLANG